MAWRVESGRWYGWPDYSAGFPVFSSEFQPPDGTVPPRILAEDPNPPQRPVVQFAVHAGACGMDIARTSAFGPLGAAYVALFGDMAAGVGKVQHPVGFKVVRVDLASGDQQDIVSNRKAGAGAPATWLASGGLERPIAVRFAPGGAELYVVDFGVLRMEGKQPRPQRGTGVLWRVRAVPK